MTARKLFFFALAALTTAIVTPGCGQRPARVVVLAAASAIDVMEAAAADFAASSDGRVDVSFGPTSVLARQIEEGAPADLFVAASSEWADYVEAATTVHHRIVVAGNALVVVVPGAASGRIATTPISDLAALAAAPALATIAVADPASVPAGMYATQALRSAGVWEAMESRLIAALDARAALRLVETGEVDAGIVYATGALAADDVTVALRIDPNLHAPIEYFLLLLAEAPPEARDFFDFLLSERGRAHFRDRGFTVAASPTRDH